MHHDVARKASDDSGERTLKTKDCVIITHIPTDRLISTFRRARASEDEAERGNASHVRTLHSTQIKSKNIK